MKKLFRKNNQKIDSTAPHYWEDESMLGFDDEMDSNCPTHDAPGADVIFLSLAFIIIFFILIAIVAVVLFFKF